MDPGLLDLLAKDRDNREFERIINGNEGKEFPASLSMYNLGIKDQRT